MADLNAAAARTTFIHHGFIAVADPTTKHVEEPGRADLKLLRGGWGVCVEVKFGWEGFSFSDWRENQREWAVQYCMAPPFSTEYWIYLTIGLDKQKSLSSSKFSPAWLIPYKRMLEVEALVSPIQDTIPYEAGKQHRLALRGEYDDDGRMLQRPLDAKHQFEDYELIWHPKNSLVRPVWNASKHTTYQGCVWTIPDNHPFLRRQPNVQQRPAHQNTYQGFRGARQN